MAWYIFLALLGVAYYRWPKFRAFAHVVLIIMMVIGGLMLAHTGYIGPFFQALVAIPVDFVMGLGGVIYHLI